MFKILETQIHKSIKYLQRPQLSNKAYHIGQTLCANFKNLKLYKLHSNKILAIINSIIIIKKNWG